MIRFLTLLLLISCNSWGALPLTFNQLTHESFEEIKERYDQQEVAIRGFFYTKDDGKPLLASQPNLKSCCIGTKKKIHSQIALLGENPSFTSSRAVTIQGLFVVDPTYNGEDDLIGLYFLKKYQILPEENGTFVILLIGILVIVVLVTLVRILFFSRKK